MTLTQLLQRVEDEASATAQAMVSGQCSTYEQYAAKVARVRAFQEVVAWATEPEKKSESTKD